MSARLLALVLCGTALAGPGPDIDEACRAARKDLVRDLEKIMLWAHQERLALDRNGTCELILVVVPDHPQARKILGYKRQKDGTWFRRRPPAPRNLNPKQHDSWLGRMLVATTRFADAVTAVLDEKAARKRPALVAELIRVAPEHDGARALAGQARYGSGWVLRETAAGKKRREELEQLARKAFADLDAPAPGTVQADEKGWGVPWKFALQTRTWRLVTTCDAEEALSCARAAGAAQPFFESVFRVRMPKFAGRTVLLMTSQQQFRSAIAKHPAFSAEQRKRYENLAAAWLPDGPQFLTWGDERRLRRELCARQVIGHLLNWKFGLTTKQGWAWEGVGLYLTERLIGTKQIYYVQWDARYGGAGAEARSKWRAMLERVDWLLIARRLLDQGKLPELLLLLPRDVNQLGAEDLVASYALATYVLEGRAVDASLVLQRLAQGTAANDVFERTLGLTVPALEKRFHTWLREQRPPADPK